MLGFPIMVEWPCPKSNIFSIIPSPIIKPIGNHFRVVHFLTLTMYYHIKWTRSPFIDVFLTFSPTYIISFLEKDKKMGQHIDSPKWFNNKSFRWTHDIDSFEHRMENPMENLRVPRLQLIPPHCSPQENIADFSTISTKHRSFGAKCLVMFWERWNM